MAQRSARELTSSNLLLCEGTDDVGFFQGLIRQRNLPDYCIRTTSEKRGLPAGYTKFGRALRGVRTATGFDRVRRVLLVADNDEDPVGRFQNIATQVQELLGASPPAPLQSIAVDNYELAIMMVPWTGVAGRLETLFVESAQDRDAHMADFVDEFVDHAGIVGRWNDDLAVKDAWLRSDLAIRCKQNPFIYLGTAFTEHPELIPLDHGSFDQIANFVRDFAVKP